MNKQDKIKKLEEELCYMDALFFDLENWKIGFINYINEKIKEDKSNKSIYEEILKECQTLFDII